MGSGIEDLFNWFDWSYWLNWWLKPNQWNELNQLNKFNVGQITDTHLRPVYLGAG